METQQNDRVNLTCKHCGAAGVLKYGTYKGVQRYWCKVCKRKFKAEALAAQGRGPDPMV